MDVDLPDNAFGQYKIMETYADDIDTVTKRLHNAFSEEFSEDDAHNHSEDGEPSPKTALINMLSTMFCHFMRIALAIKNTPSTSKTLSRAMVQIQGLLGYV